jgi:signal transduction histidine kinase
LRAIRGEVINGAEFFLRGAEGSEGIWLTATGRPLLDEKGRGQGGVVVLSDITSRKSLEKQIAEISDREQRRIGQDLHDGLCQHLVSIAFAGELLREKLARQQLAEAAQAEAIVEMVNEGISEARNLARGLYPVRLEVDGLASALEELAAGTQERTGIVCRFSCDAPVCIFDEVAGSNLYRITQEAVNNAVKHAECQTISIGLGAVEEEVTLTIKDDGAGFTGAESNSEGSGGMGLSIMKYRAKMIGASLDIRPGYGGGTIVICSFHNEDVVEKRHVHSTQI